MCILQDPARPDSLCEAPIQDRDLTTAFTAKDDYEEIVKKAESVSITKLFKYYGIGIDQFNRKCTCPFPKHKGGRESTASFYYYHDTNTFWCFGCKTGTTSVDLVSNMEGYNKLQSSLKILNLFNDDSFQIELNKDVQDSYKEKNDLIFALSEKIREMLLTMPQNQEKIEEICYSFDKMNDKYELDLNALKYVIEKINFKLEEIK